MGICIAGRSAMNWWFSEGRNLINDAPVSLMTREELRSTELEVQLALDRFATSGELETIVSNHNERTHRKNIVEHSYSDIYALKLFYQMDATTQICCPEIALLQMLRTMGDIEWIVLASQAFSIYDPNDYLHRVPALSTPEKCAEVLNSIPYCCKANRARKLLAKCVTRAASPREIQVALLLTLPRRMGGYGLPRPELNGVIKLGAKQAQEVGVASLSCDEVWRKQKVIAEYESDQHHASPLQLGVDSRRRAILRNKGYRVHTITNNQIIYANETDRLAEAISRDLKYRPNMQVKDYARRKEELRSVILEAGLF